MKYAFHPEALEELDDAAGVVRSLAVEDKISTVAAGKRADLMVVETYPLNDIRNNGKSVGVVVRGWWIPPDRASA